VPFRTKVHTKPSGMDHTVLPANNTMPRRKLVLTDDGQPACCFENNVDELSSQLI